MFGATYRGLREEMARVVAGACGLEPVPTCPGWTVADVVRHVTGLADDWVKGSLEVYASPEWTAAQVARFSALDLADVMAAWAERAQVFEPMLEDVTASPQVPDEITTVIGRLPSATFPGGICVDLAQHVHDVASALGADVELAEPSIDRLSKMMLASIRGMWALVDGPPLSVSTSGGLERDLDGSGEPVTLHASSVDLFRTLGGRRTAAQVLDLDWSGPEESRRRAADHLVVPFFRAPAEPVE